MKLEVTYIAGGRGDDGRHLVATCEVIPHGVSLTLGSTTETAYKAGDKIVIDITRKAADLYIYSPALSIGDSPVKVVRLGKGPEYVALVQGRSCTEFEIRTASRGESVHFKAIASPGLKSPFAQVGNAESAAGTRAPQSSVDVVPGQRLSSPAHIAETEQASVTIEMLSAIVEMNSSLGSRISSVNARLEQFADNAAQLEDRFLRGQQHISKQIASMHDELLQPRMPAPPTGRDSEQYIAALRGLFDVFGGQKNETGAATYLPRDIISTHLNSLLNALARIASPSLSGEVDAESSPSQALRDEIADLADKLGGADPAQRFEMASGRGDVAGAIAALTALAKDFQRAELLSDEHIEIQLMGFAKSIWAWNEDAIDRADHPANRPLADALGLAGIAWFLPFENAYDASRHRVGGREPARPGEPVNQVVAVIHPGFEKTDGATARVLEKATVVISDY